MSSSKAVLTCPSALAPLARRRADLDVLQLGDAPLAWAPLVLQGPRGGTIEL